MADYKKIKNPRLRELAKRSVALLLMAPEERDRLVAGFAALTEDGEKEDIKVLEKEEKELGITDERRLQIVNEYYAKVKDIMTEYSSKVRKEKERLSKKEEAKEEEEILKELEEI